MNFSFYRSLGIEDPVWNHGSLDTQIQWFKELMPSICGTEQSCKAYLRKSLFMFGAYGGNDYNVQLLELDLTPLQAMNYTPKIVTAIANGVEVAALQQKHHNSTRIMYADYYGLVYQMVQEPEKFGECMPFVFL
ncbi:hypothetical protein ZWY2020_050684 [Hordeum vulgare]|nr:hypothetical protein ZWY2020_050684 [Hordeum vulgare]